MEYGRKAMKKILFITGTRADYGKIKSLIKGVEEDPNLEAYVYVSGMHLIAKFGNTYQEVLKDKYKNVYVDFSQNNTGDMSYDLGNVICNLTGYAKHVQPDMIVVHGDRIDALAGAIVGALNNYRVAHIEGGELSGTIDESIRHAISKFSHLHFVCNEEAKTRLLQMGEHEEDIYIIGSPDIDIMLSDELPSLAAAKERYDINYDKYGILMYHPVTTEFDILENHVKELMDALVASEKNYVVVYPNNDYGSEIIMNAYKKLEGNPHFKMFPSIRLEYFLTLLKNAEFMIGNSSAGVRETSVYGIPAIDVGTRQSGRYSLENTNIQHVEEDKQALLNAIGDIENYRVKSFDFGRGESTERFMETVRSTEIWERAIQKSFVDLTRAF